MSECVFCSLSAEENLTSKIWENEKFFSVLDLFPNTPGQVLVLTKKHFNSNVLKMDKDYYAEFMLAAQEVSELMVKKLNVKRVSLVVEGMGVDHAHIKLYPMHGLEEEFVETLGSHQVFFEKYAGHICTLMGPMADENKLAELAEEFKK